MLIVGAKGFAKEVLEIFHQKNETEKLHFYDDVSSDIPDFLYNQFKVLKNEEELRDAGLQSMTEVKFENSISRATAVANPRQIERVVRGSVFKLDLIYELEEEQEFLEDMETLAEAMKLLQYDYLGGNGSRGYGKIQFQDIYTDAVVGHVDNTLLEKCNSILNEAVKE